jgi:hypothetical protein
VRDLVLRRIAARRHLDVPSLIADRRVTDEAPASTPDADVELVDA